MKNTRNNHFKSLSQEDVLAFVLDWYRFAEALEGECEEDVLLSFESTIEEWRTACNLVEANKLGQALNNIFNISGTSDEWCGVLEDTCTLRDLCDFVVSKGSVRHAVAPFKIAGIECLDAGAFIALRSALVDAGAPVSNVKPSTALAPTFHEHFSAIFNAMAKLAPGTLPIPKSRYHELFSTSWAYFLLVSLLLTSCAFLVFPGGFVKQLLVSELIYFTLVCMICKRWIFIKFGSDMYIEGLDTFADLTRLLLVK